MPLRSPKMNRFILGFQRRVWCPKWTPASSSCFIVTTAVASATVRPFRSCSRPRRRPRAAPGRCELLLGCSSARWRPGEPGRPRNAGVRDPGSRSNRRLESGTSVAGDPDRSVGEQSPDVRYNAFERGPWRRGRPGPCPSRCPATVDGVRGAAARRRCKRCSPPRWPVRCTRRWRTSAPCSARRSRRDRRRPSPSGPGTELEAGRVVEQPQPLGVGCRRAQPHRDEVGDRGAERSRPHPRARRTPVRHALDATTYETGFRTF